jgi:hypothetical protein
MTFWMALLIPVLLQEPADDLRKEIDKLKKQNVELQERLSLLEQSAVEDAQTIQRLRQVVKLLEGATPADAPSPVPNLGPSPKPVLGPVKPVKGRLVYVDAKNNFVTLGIGKKEGVEQGYKFEIYRETYENGGESKLTRLGAGEFEKYMGQDSMSKLIITEGTIAEMKADDLAVAIRKLGAVETPKEPPKPAPMEPAKDGVYAITGRTNQSSNAGYVINFASPQGAKQTMLVYCYRDGKFRAKLRLDKVEKTYSVGYIVDGAMESPPDTGDQIYLKEISKGLTGKVALSDDKNGRLAIDLRQRDGVKPGMHCELRRLGQKIGTVMITEVQSWGSWAKPDGDLKIDQIQKGDFVEAIEEK